MLKWIRNKLTKDRAEDDVEDIADEIEEKYEPVGVRVRPHESVSIKPADTYVAGYNVDESVLNTDDEHSTTVNDIKTTGIDPYNTGYIDQSDGQKPDPEK